MEAVHSSSGVRCRPSVVLAVAILAAALTAAIGAVIGADRSARAQEATDAAPSLFVPIDAYRTWDSRIGIDGHAAKHSRTVDNLGVPARLHPSLVIAGPNPPPVPDDAVAVSFNVTVTDTEGAGFAQVDVFGGADGSTSTVNWNGPGQTVSNSGVVGLVNVDDAGNLFEVYIGGDSEAKTHLVVDITGYFVQPA